MPGRVDHRRDTRHIHGRFHDGVRVRRTAGPVAREQGQKVLRAPEDRSGWAGHPLRVGFRPLPQTTRFAGNGVDEVTDRIRRQRLGRAGRAPAGPDASSALIAFTASMLAAPRSARPATALGLRRRASRCSPPTVGPPATPRGCGRSLRPSRTSVSIDSGVLQTRQRIAAMRVNG